MAKSYSPPRDPFSDNLAARSQPEEATLGKKTDGLGKFNSRHHKGAYSEMAACMWLLKQGYEVFRNISCTGPIDIVAWNRKTGEFFPYDVKSMASYERKDGSFGYAVWKGSNKANIPLLHILSDGSVFVEDTQIGNNSSSIDPFLPSRLP